MSFSNVSIIFTSSISSPHASLINHDIAYQLDSVSLSNSNSHEILLSCSSFTKSAFGTNIEISLYTGGKLLTSLNSLKFHH
ncbi:MAG: hypothetical protein WCG25_05330 [bacterium]